jgi:hypothetical protein
LKVYVIQELGWDYNDEYSFQPGCGGGNPTRSFFSRQRAEEEMARMQKDKESQDDKDNYGYDLNSFPQFFEIIELTVEDAAPVPEPKGESKKRSPAERAALGMITRIKQ